MNILVPTDFSEEAEWGIQAAEVIAEKSNSEVILLNIIHPPNAKEFSATGDVYQKKDIETEAFTAKLIEKNQDLIYQMVKKYSNPDRMKGRVVIDYWQEGINKMVQEYQTDLIVMGTTAENTLKEKFVGNNTEKVIRNVDCPVLVFNRPPIGYKARKFLLALDPAIDFDASVKMVGKIAEELNAEIGYLNVADHAKDVDDRQQQLEEKLRTLGSSDPAVTIIADENLEEALKKTAAAYHSDTLVMLTHGKSGWQSVLSNSKTEKMIRKMEIPVLSVNFSEINK